MRSTNISCNHFLAIAAVFLASFMIHSNLSLCLAADKPLAADLVSDGQKINLDSRRYQGLFKELRLRYNFNKKELERLFAGVTVKKRVLERMDAQYEALPYYRYYPIFITESRIRKGREKLAEHEQLLDKIEKEYGVEKEIIVAIWGIESHYGDHEGNLQLFRTLNTLFDGYPRRRIFYRKQLISFLLLCRENNVVPHSVKGSYGGAFGQPQLIPTSFREYARDFDGDGKRDVWQSVPDILASIANYLHNFHWVYDAPIYHDIGSELKSKELKKAYSQGRKGKVSRKQIMTAQGISIPPSPDQKKLTIIGLEQKNGDRRYLAGYPNFQAITAWNHSNHYAMAVSELAEKF
ncbi:MAG: lytic murein transglycosylase [Desulfobia sp.]